MLALARLCRLAIPRTASGANPFSVRSFPSNFVSPSRSLHSLPRRAPASPASFVIRRNGFQAQQDGSDGVTTTIPGKSRKELAQTGLESALRRGDAQCNDTRLDGITSEPLTTTTIQEIQVLESGMILLIPLLAFLKSSTVLKSVTIISRLALTLLPISFRAKILHQTRTAVPLTVDGSAYGKGHHEYTSRWWRLGGDKFGRLNAGILLPMLVGLPVFLLGATLVASLERVPITARWRTIMLHPEEEEELIQASLNLGGDITPRSDGDYAKGFGGGTSRDWIGILNNVFELEEGGFSVETGRRIFFGGEVLDGRDWRYRWTVAVWRNLEHAAARFASPSPSISTTFIPTSSSSLTTSPNSAARGGLVAPPSEHPLRTRKAKEIVLEEGDDGEDKELSIEYDVIVVQNDEFRAFVYGFAPEAKDNRGRRGVVVVYTGLIDAILGQRFVPSHFSTDNNWDPFGQLFPTASALRRANVGPVDLNSMNTPPIDRPTPAESHELAVVLAHELSHLLLSHSLEGHTSSLLLPALSKMFLDVCRVIVFPMTVLLGPFVSDAIGDVMQPAPCSVGGLLDCRWSRNLELEADAVGLRILASAGIDPRVAITFWENRLRKENLLYASPSPSNPSTLLLESPAEHIEGFEPQAEMDEGIVAGEDMIKEDKSWYGFWRTHPADAERAQKIREELGRWEKVALS